MLIEFKELEYCKVEIDYALDKEQVESKQNEIAQLFKNSAIPGFRTGKASLSAIKNFYRNKINDMAKSELCQTAVHSAIAEKNIKPFGQPKFNSIKLSGNQFSCNFNLHILPNIELTEYKGFDLPKGQTPDVNEVSATIIEKVRQMNGTTVPFTENDVAQNGDEVIVNYQAFINNEQQPTISIEGDIVSVGQAHIEAVNENLIGMKLGEKREFITIVPPDSVSTKLANKETRFTIELTMGSKKNPAALDDELAQKVGAKDIADLINIVNGEASNKVQEMSRKHLFEQIASRLTKAHNIDIPKWILDAEIKMLVSQNNHDMDKLSDEQKNFFTEVAQTNIKLSLILDKIRENEPDAQMSDEEVFKIIGMNIGRYKSILPGMGNKSDEEVINSLQSSGFMSTIVNHIKDDFAMDFLIKNSNIVE